jgi:hypothetical protein
MVLVKRSHGKADAIYGNAVAQSNILDYLLAVDSELPAANAPDMPDLFNDSSKQRLTSVPHNP